MSSTTGSLPRLVVPDILSRRCAYFTACGELERAVSLPEQDRKVVISKYRRKGEQFFLRLMRTGKRHVHFDLAQHLIFGDKPPTAKATLKEVAGLVGKAYGKKMTARIRGLFVLDSERLVETSFYKAYVKPRTAIRSELSVGITGIKLYVSEEPYATVEWREYADNKFSAFISMHPVVLELGSDYLKQAFRTLTSCYESTFGKEST